MEIEFLRQILTYNPETGELVWLKRSEAFFKRAVDAHSWNLQHANRRAFKTFFHGYLHGNIFKKHYYAHRLAWALHYGEWPAGQIDHINGVRSDNRIENLRDVSHSENQKNTKLRHDNKAGAPGIDWKKNASAWRVRVSRGGKRHVVGYFKTLDDAVFARKEAQSQAAYHANHGRIAERHFP